MRGAMIAAYQLLLADDGNLLDSILLAPWLTYALLFGAAYGAYSWARDVLKFVIRVVGAKPRVSAAPPTAQGPSAAPERPDR